MGLELKGRVPTAPSPPDTTATAHQTGHPKTADYVLDYQDLSFTANTNDNFIYKDSLGFPFGGKDHVKKKTTNLIKSKKLIKPYLNCFF